jgi:hypothetical protein
MAEVQAIVCSDDHIGNVRMGVEERESLFEQAVGVVREHVAGGDEEGQVRPLLSESYRADGGISSDEGPGIQ